MLEVLLVERLHALIQSHAPWWRIQVLLGVIYSLKRRNRDSDDDDDEMTTDQQSHFTDKSRMSYLHAVVNILNHRELLSFIHTLPLLWWRLTWTYHTVLALGGRDSEVVSGVGLRGDGIGLWTRR